MFYKDYLNNDFLLLELDQQIRIKTAQAIN